MRHGAARKIRGNEDSRNITWIIKVEDIVVMRLGSGEGLGDGGVVQ